jgi:hypothetical protein
MAFQKYNKASISLRSQGKTHRHYKYHSDIITMQPREKCVIDQGGEIGFYLTLPQIAVFIVYSVDGR